jgi:phospholipid/cholesterol/gamma-HCH transport system substrate-binding protein
VKSRRRERPALDILAGLLTIALIAGLAVFAYKYYKGDVDPGVRVTVHASRSGLLLDPGSKVSVRGVRVGTVRSVTSRQGRAEILMDLDPLSAKGIPANVQADLQPTTLFGAKYVELVMPARAAPASLRTGDVVPERAHGLETDQVFQNVLNLLTVVQPQKINEATTALAGALQGRGERLGRTVTELDTYLVGLLPSVPQLNADLALANRVAPTYIRVAPDLVQAMDNFRTTSNTLTTRQAQILASLTGVTTAVGDTTALVIDVAEPLTDATRHLRAPTATLDRYAPELTCLLVGAANVTRGPGRLSTPIKYPGIWGNAGFLPAAETYRYPEDLPKVAADAGPNCFGLPVVSAGNPPPHYDFDVGRSPFKNGVPVR